MLSILDFSSYSYFVLVRVAFTLQSISCWPRCEIWLMKKKNWMGHGSRVGLTRCRPVEVEEMTSLPASLSICLLSALVPFSLSSDISCRSLVEDSDRGMMEG